MHSDGVMYSQMYMLISSEEKFFLQLNGIKVIAAIYKLSHKTIQLN